MGASVDAVKASSALVYSININNSANSVPSYVRLFNLASGSVIVGTTAPDSVLYVPANAVVSFALFTGVLAGITFGTALSACCVTTGGTAGVTAPLSSVAVTITYV
jgi:hypothetical protein